jgi:hypothetical protein
MLRIATAGADDQVTWEAFNALGMIGNRAITPSLLDLLSQTTEPTRRQQIVYALWFLADRRSIPTLLRLLADVEEDDSVRGYAAEGLGSHRHTTEILEALAAALSDSSVNVRVSALCALSGAHRVVPKENRNVFQMKVVPAVIGRLTDQEGCQGEETIAEMARSLLDAWNLPVPDAYGAP